MPLESYNPGLSALVSYLILTYLMPLESLVCTVCDFAETVECELLSPFTSDSLIGANCWSELFQHWHVTLQNDSQEGEPDDKTQERRYCTELDSTNILTTNTSENVAEVILSFPATFPPSLAMINLLRWHKRWVSLSFPQIALTAFIVLKVGLSQQRHLYWCHTVD